MNLLETIVLVLMVIIMVSTFITEPKLSYEYYKACTKSGVKIFSVGKEFISNIGDKDRQVGGTNNESEDVRKGI